METHAGAPLPSAAPNRPGATGEEHAAAFRGPREQGSGAAPMERVIVIGSPGAGKSTFARRLRDERGPPLTYLDMIWHLPNGENVAREEFDARLDAALKGERWVIDGNYLRTLERRLERSDTVFFFDLPVETCLAGARSRIGRPREDLPWVERELDPAFADYIARFPREQRPAILAALGARPARVRLVTFRSHEEADAFRLGARQRRPGAE